jgi:3'-5' exoribonuclease
MPEVYRKTQPIATWAPGDEFEDVFIIDGLRRRVRKSGEPFYAVTLADSSGRIDAMVWNDIESFEQRGYRTDMYVYARGSVGEFQGKNNASLAHMRPLEADEVDPHDFVATSPYPLEPMIEEFRARIAEVQDTEMNVLLNRFFDERGKLWHDFIIAPSARTVHQAYLHGLIEHTLNVARNAVNLAAADQNARLIDRDLLLAGALIHDIGKTVEFRWTPRIDYTEEGLLLGHISIGANMLTAIASQIEIGAGKVAHLEHLILSHHGRLDYGSPRVPATAEAFILHYADYADAQLAVYEELADEAQKQGEFVSPFSQFIDRRIVTLPSNYDSPNKAQHYVDELAGLE